MDELFSHFCDCVVPLPFADSPESALREIGIFFPNFDVKKWHQEDQKHFIADNVFLCPKEFVHLIKRDNTKTLSDI